MISASQAKPPIRPEDNVAKSRIYLDATLNLLREAKDAIIGRPQVPGGRELAEAITCIETGCMWMNRSQFADKPYSPVIQSNVDTKV